MFFLRFVWQFVFPPKDVNNRNIFTTWTEREAEINWKNKSLDVVPAQKPVKLPPIKEPVVKSKPR